MFRFWAPPKESPKDFNSAASTVPTMKGFINFDIAEMQTLLLGLLTSYQTSLSNVDINSLYGMDSLQAGDYHIVTGPDNQNYDEATRYCALAHADLFTVRKDMNVHEVFSKLNIDGGHVWTNIYKSKSTGILRDQTGFPPITTTDYEILDLLSVNVDTLAATEAISVEIINGSAIYSVRERSSTIGAHTVCVKLTPFPQRTPTMQSLLNLKGLFELELNRAVEEMRYVKQYTERQLLLLPTGLLEENTPEIALPPHIKSIKTDIEELNNEFPLIVNQFAKIFAPLDIIELQERHHWLLDDAKHLGSRCLQVVFSPIGLVESSSIGLLTSQSELRVFTVPGKPKLIVEISAKTALQTVAPIIKEPPAEDSPQAAGPVMDLQSAVLPGGTDGLQSTLNPSSPAEAPAATRPGVKVPPVTSRYTVRKRESTVTSMPTSTTQMPTSNNQSDWFKEFVNLEKWTWSYYLSYLLWSALAMSVWEFVNLLISLSIIFTLCSSSCQRKWRSWRKKPLPVIRQVRTVRFEERSRTRSASAPVTPTRSPAPISRVIVARERTPESTRFDIPARIRTRIKRRAPPPPYQYDDYNFEEIELYDPRDVPLHLADSLLSL